jgi:hypothetical protein
LKKWQEWELAGRRFAAQGKQDACLRQAGATTPRETQEHSPFDFAQGKQEWLCHPMAAATM